jgi:DNA-binding transcriptional regulator/RsmH inhibitor MraZ
VGLWDHFEIWSPDRLEAHRAGSAGTFEDRAKGFFGRNPQGR